MNKNAAQILIILKRRTGGGIALKQLEALMAEKGSESKKYEAYRVIRMDLLSRQRLFPFTGMPPFAEILLQPIPTLALFCKLTPISSLSK